MKKRYLIIDKCSLFICFVSEIWTLDKLTVDKLRTDKS